MATSREPIGVAGEVTWRVPSLSLADEAIELFTDRARHVRPDFAVTDANPDRRAKSAGASTACRWRSSSPRPGCGRLSPAEILDSLHDRFRLLTGGARTAVRRQQTLRASVDWSHALLTEPERCLFRRLAVFMGGFDLDAAQAVAGSGDVRALPGAGPVDPAGRQVTRRWPRASVTERDTGCWRRCVSTRMEKLGESGEADAVRSVTATTTRLWRPCTRHAG